MRTNWKYRALSRAVLVKIPDDELQEAVLDYILSKIDSREEKELEIVRGLAKSFQMLYSTWFLQAEVNNGGFSQYFWNSRSQFSKEALQGLRVIGAAEYADLLGKATAVYNKHASKLEKLRSRGTNEAFSQHQKILNLEPLEDRFYTLEEGRILDNLRIKYIREHPDEFVGN